MTTMVWVTIGWLAGIAWPGQGLISGAICAAIALMSWLLRRRRLCAVVTPLGLGLAAGAIILSARPEARPSPEIEQLARRSVTVYGHVAAEPSYRSTTTRVRLAVEAVEHDGTLSPTQGHILVTLDRYPVRRYGERLAVTGRLEPVPPASDPFGRYLAAQGIHGTMAWVDAQRLPGWSGSPFLRWLYGLKELARDSIQRILPEPEAGLLSSILLGMRHTLPQQVDEAFRRSGLTHVIVISGFAIGLVLQQTVVVLGQWSPRRITLFVGAGVIILYTFFVGPSPPVTRAALMGILLVLAELAGRRPHVLTSLAWASLLMTAANPSLVWDASFHLSMVSTLALIGLTPVFDQWTLTLLRHRLSSENARHVTRLLSAYLLATLAAQLLTFPIIWHHFGEISLVALPANLLALPVRPLITILGGVAAVFGLIWEPLGRLTGLFAYVPLWWTTTVARAFGGLPGAAWQLPAPSTATLLAFYGVVGGSLLIRHLGRTGSKAVTWARERFGALSLVAVSLLLLVGLAAQLTKLPDGRLHVHVLDVGQGDGMLIRTPAGTTILVDGGPDPTVLGWRLHQVLPVWHRRIDLIVVTHGHADHLAGLIPLPRRYRVGTVLQPEVMGEEPLAEAWEEQLQRASITPVPALRGQSIELDDGVALRVMHPAEHLLAGGDLNENSVVLLLTMGEFTMLLTGDIEAEGESSLVRAGLISPVTVLKVAHHGALTSTDEAFLAACRPQLAVISVGKDNSLGHPSWAVLDRLGEIGARVLRTDEDGTIQIITDGQRMWVR